MNELYVLVTVVGIS